MDLPLSPNQPPASSRNFTGSSRRKGRRSRSDLAEQLKAAKRGLTLGEAYLEELLRARQGSCKDAIHIQTKSLQIIVRQSCHCF